MMTTMPSFGRKKKKSLITPPKTPDFANKKPMMKVNKPAPLLGRNLAKKD